jgi:hypothetical protein
VWSAGDYSHDLTGFTLSTSVSSAEVSSETSLNADHSIKIIPGSGGYGILKVEYNFIQSTTYLFSCYCKNTVNGATLELRNNSNQVIQSVSIPVSNSFQFVSLGFTNASNGYTITFRTYDSNYVLYLDNLSLTIP